MPYKIHGGNYRIHTNLIAWNTHRQLSVNSSNVAKSTEKLSSGRRVNRADDDAAGLAISEKMRAQIRALNMASKNSQDAISLLQTAEGALTETHAILQRMRELSVQSASDTNGTGIDRDALNAEFQELKTEVDDIASKTKFNNMELLTGNFGLSIDTNVANSTILGVGTVLSVDAKGSSAATVLTIQDTAGAGGFTVSDGTTTVAIAGLANGKQTVNVAEFDLVIKLDSAYTTADLDGTTIQFIGSGGKMQTGSNQNDNLQISIDAMTSSNLAIGASKIETRTDAEDAITAVNNAINDVSTQRAKLGALQNRFEHKIKNLDTSAENLGAAESRIRDLDIAKEMTKFTSNNILVQAATAMLSQANNAPQSVLQLLK